MADTDNQQWYPEPDKEQQEAAEVQQSRDVASLPAVQDILDWYDNRIDFFNSPAAMAINEHTPPEEAKFIALMCKHFAAVYTDERQTFVTKFTKYIQEAADAA